MAKILSCAPARSKSMCLFCFLSSCIHLLRGCLRVQRGLRYTSTITLPRTPWRGAVQCNGDISAVSRHLTTTGQGSRRPRGVLKCPSTPHRVAALCGSTTLSNGMRPQNLRPSLHPTEQQTRRQQMLRIIFAASSALHGLRRESYKPIGTSRQILQVLPEPAILYSICTSADTPRGCRPPHIPGIVTIHSRETINLHTSHSCRYIGIETSSPRSPHPDLHLRRQQLGIAG